MQRSASAAIVNDGFARPVDPSMSAPSTTYKPGWFRTRPSKSQALPRTAPPSGCADTAGLTAGRREPELESLGRSRGEDTSGAEPSRGVGFAEFLGEISGAMVAAQQRLDGQTESYLAGSTSPLPLPTMFRIPRLAAEMKFALSTESAEGFRLSTLCDV